MEDGSDDAFAALEPAPSDRVSLVECGDDLGPFLCPDRRGAYGGDLAGAQGEQRAAAVARVLLRSRGQARDEASGPGGPELFCALAGLGVELVGRATTGPGHRCHGAGCRFVVLTVSVVYRGCAIPVAWTVLAGNTKHAWRGEWLRMLRQVRPAVPASWTVMVLADRGLYARWLYRRSVRLGWHPFLRINTGGTFRPEARNRFQPLRSLAPRPGSRWQGRGTAFVSRPCRLDCTLLACWEEGYKDAWFILTDLPPESSEACWYGLRAWIEQGFKITKRGGWQWQRTRMTDPERAARLWLAVAVVTLWLLSVGGAAGRRLESR
jgi:hypothetical protein